MRRTTSILFIAAAVSALASRVLAHDGHGDPRLQDTVLHYLIEPAHWPLALAAALLVVLAASRVRRRATRRR